MAIPNVTQTVERATRATCPACEINTILRECGQAGAWTKATTLRKSKNVRAVYVHTCQEKGQNK